MPASADTIESASRVTRARGRVGCSVWQAYSVLTLHECPSAEYNTRESICQQEILAERAHSLGISSHGRASSASGGYTPGLIPRMKGTNADGEVGAPPDLLPPAPSLSARPTPGTGKESDRIALLESLEGLPNTDPCASWLREREPDMPPEADPGPLHQSVCCAIIAHRIRKPQRLLSVSALCGKGG